MSKYFGVIGNRDYIKRDKGTDSESKAHFWDYLDELPQGWLTSLVYKRSELPEGLPIIADCGAWSWKDQDAPHLGRHPVTAQLILDAYLASPLPVGAIVVAPDHMLIPRYGNLDDRRAFNRRAAAEFLPLARATHFVPMATAHGATLDERIGRISELTDLGYTHIALGGLAGRASNKREWLSMVKSVRHAFPSIYLHILGLSSPEYAAEWARLGVDSFDGSAHFKAAFTGTWYWYNEGRMEKHQARGERNPDAQIDIECDCRACATLRKEGIDTRQFGSNENNMGRAAHNQNMLHRALRASMQGPRTVALVSCVGEKTATPAPAAELYQSAWFKKARAWAEQSADRWYILSAEYGLLRPGAITAPYERTLNAMGRQERSAWAEKALSQIVTELKEGDRVIVLAGERYRADLVPALRRLEYTVEIPLQGLGIGEQLAWFKGQMSPESDQLCFW
jgi:hypothetical protein